MVVMVQTPEQGKYVGLTTRHDAGVGRSVE
jgi:hypothetical protein